MSEGNVEKAKKSGRSRTHVHVHYYENLNKPTHPAETPGAVRSLPADEEMCAEPDVGKGTMGNAHQPDGRNLSAARVSPSRVQGNASPATDDHGAALPPGYVPGPRETAWMHPDMRSGTVSPVPLLSMRTDANPHPRDLSGAAGVAIALSRLDAAGAAGMPGFRQEPSGNPAMRGSPRIAPIGPSNGSHGLADAQSHAVANKSNFEIMRDAVREQLGS